LSTSPAVVVIGSLNTDHIVRVDRLPLEGETVTGDSYLVAAGGKGLNQAVAAARQGASVAFVGCVGGDPAGRYLLDLLREEGVGVDSVRVAEGAASGVALVTVAASGANTVVVAPLANRMLATADIEAAGHLIDGARVVLAQLEVPHAAVLAGLSRARAAGGVAILNPAPAAGPLPAALLEVVDVLVPNETEAAALTGLAVEDAALALRRAGPATVIVTLGSAGALAVTGEGVSTVHPFDVRVVDPTGAGDAFSGTLAAALAAGQPLEAALRRSSAAGALAATAAGAVPSLPAAPAVDALLRA
jgi:ribokinase